LNTEPPLSQRAACATTDFAMQNVLLQMNLIVLLPENSGAGYDFKKCCTSWAYVMATSKPVLFCNAKVATKLQTYYDQIT
jgi:rRNA maturation endonuclease Nob1